MMLKCDHFEVYRCDESFSIGLNMANLHKIFGAFNAGSLNIQCEESDSDTVKFTFEDDKNSKKQCYELRLMDLDNEQLGIPEQDYEATFTMPSAEFTRIVKDLLVMGESVTICVTKGEVMFKAEGDVGKPDIRIKADEKLAEGKKKKKSSKGKGKDKSKDKKKSKKGKGKDKKGKGKVKEEAGSDVEEEVEAMDESDDDDDEDNDSNKSDDEDNDEANEVSSDEDSDEETQSLVLNVKESIELSFATQYLKKFTAAGPLANAVSISLSKDVPMVIAYEIKELGHLKYFLAPKIDDEDED